MGDSVRPAWALVASAPGMAAEHQDLREQVAGYFRELRDPLYRYLLGFGKGPGEAEEIVQETFLELYRRLREKKPIEQVRGWVFAVARNLAAKESRQRVGITAVSAEVWEEISESCPDSGATPEESLLRTERARRITEAARSLTGLQRQCLHLRGSGLRYSEIAAILRISEDGAKDIVYRAIHKLRKKLHG